MKRLHRSIERRWGVVFGTYTVDLEGRPWVFLDSGSKVIGTWPSLRLGRHGFFVGKHGARL